MTPIEILLSKLQNVKPTGQNQWMASCSSHQDKNPSLSITQKDGKVLLHCFAGCSLDDVLAGLEIDKSDLFADAAKTQRQIVATYDYVDKGGKLSFQKIRYEPKDFRIRTPDGHGGWNWKLNGTAPVLYNLPGVINADTVFLVEGEKDVENLRRVGLTGTCNFDGASKDSQKPKWRTDYNSYFANKAVFVIPDNDPPGRAHALNAYRNIKGIAKHARIISLPGLREGGDVSDYLAVPTNSAESLQALCLSQPEIEEGVDVEELLKEDKPDTPPLKMVCMAGIVAKIVQWLWGNRIPAWALSLIVGNPGIGKTFLIMYIIAIITTGRHWPDCENTFPPGSVLLFADEDSLEYAIKPRLEAAGADCSKVYAHAADSIFTVEDQDNMKKLEDFIDEIGDCQLIVFDPITAYLGSVNANSNAEVRGVLVGLQQLAQRKKVTIIGVNHFSKKQDLDAIHRTLGSTAFVAAARSVWAVLWEKVDPESSQKPKRLFLPIKSNYSIDVEGMSYDIVDGQVAFGLDSISTSVDAAMDRNGKAMTAASREDAINWIQQQLDGEDSIPVSELKARAEKDGKSWNVIQKFKGAAGVKTWKSGMSDGWMWKLGAEE